MTLYAIFDSLTGVPLRNGAVFSPDDVALQAQSGESVKEGVHLDPKTQRVDVATGEVIAYTPPGPTLDETKAAAKAATAQRRWEIETGGVVVNGATIDTDDRSKLLLSSAAEQARDDATFTANWKTSGGAWVALDAATILAVYGAVFAHVRACFAREAELSAMIDNAASADDVAWLGAMITAFWPAL